MLRMQLAPIVAALAMGSGFAAHPYKFAQLLTPKYDYISQGEYEKAVVYINKPEICLSDN